MNAVSNGAKNRGRHMHLHIDSISFLHRTFEIKFSYNLSTLTFAVGFGSEDDAPHPPKGE